jgi:hypothetical protein
MRFFYFFSGLPVILQFFPPSAKRPPIPFLINVYGYPAEKRHPVFCMEKLLSASRTPEYNML